MLYYFQVGEKYTRRDIYRVIGISEDTKGGNWDTGYNQYKGDWFIFCNIGVPGRTGHDYGNVQIGDLLVWYGKTNTRIHNPSIQSLIDPSNSVYLFAREHNDNPFTYLGIAKAKSVENSTPVKVTWQFSTNHQSQQYRIAEEVTEAEKYIEGAIKQISINAYERNSVARQKCLDTHGYYCAVCQFNFRTVYGTIGRDFIHVHHCKPLSDIGEKYEVDPVRDLVPVCPNCHAMLHQKQPPYTVDELKHIIRYKP